MSNDGKKKRQVFVKTITRFSPFQDQMSARLNDAISSLLSPIFSKTNSFVLAVCFSSPPGWYQFKYTSRVQNNNTEKERKKKRNELTNKKKLYNSTCGLLLVSIRLEHTAEVLLVIRDQLPQTQFTVCLTGN